MQLNKQLIKYITGIWFVIFATSASASKTAKMPNEFENRLLVVKNTSIDKTKSTPMQTELSSKDLPLFNGFDFFNAMSISAVSSIEGTLYVLFGKNHSLFVSDSTDGGKTFSEPIKATGGNSVHVIEVERPALAISKDGEIAIAWLEIPPDYNGGKILYAHSRDSGKTFTPGKPIANHGAGEISMIDVAMDENGNPILTWLNGTTLQFSRSFDKGLTFTESKSISGSSCECCQPHSIANDKNIYIAYRGLEHDGVKGDIRDIMLIRSKDAGQTFEAVTRVSDTHWYLSACPVAGPSMVANKDNLYVVWMDGRFSRQGSFGRGDVWLARLKNGSKSFTSNIRINKDQIMHHTKPSVGIGSGGRVHVVWEAQGSDKNLLYYSVSDDVGQTFPEPHVIVGKSKESRGRPRMAGLVVGANGLISLAWIDDKGAHLSTWKE